MFTNPAYLAVKTGISDKCPQTSCGLANSDSAW